MAAKGTDAGTLVVHEAQRILAGEKPQVLELTLGLMLRNAEERERLWQSQLEYEQADHARTKEKLAHAYALLDKIEHRHRWLLGQTDAFEPSVEP